LINIHDLPKANIGKRGDSGRIQHPISVSAFSLADTNELRKPRLPILANRCANIRTVDSRKTIKSMKAKLIMLLLAASLAPGIIKAQPITANHSP